MNADNEQEGRQGPTHQFPPIIGEVGRHKRSTGKRRSRSGLL